MKMNKYRILCIFFSCYICFFIPEIRSQVNDANLWIAFSKSFDLPDKWKFSITEELRLKENYSRLDNLLTQFSLGKRLSDWFSADLNYRYSLKYNIESGYYHRHRIHTDLNFRLKADEWQFNNRFRIQTTADTPVFEWYFRQKIGVEKSFEDLTGGIAWEYYYPINNPKLKLLDRTRFYFSLEYKIDKRNFISGGFIIERERNVKNPWTNYILSVQYTFE